MRVKLNKKNLLIGAIGLIIFIAILKGFFYKGGNLDKNSSSMKLETVSYGTLISSVEAVGIVHARKEEKVISNVPGVVEKVLVEEGDQVEKGQVLILLFSSEIEEKVVHAREKVEQLTSKVREGEVTLKSTEEELNRARILYESKSITLQEFEKAKNAFDKVKISLQGMRASLRNAKELLGIMQSRLNETRIRASLDGVITSIEKNIHVGANVMAGQILMTVSNLKELTAEVSFDEVDARSIELSQRAVISGDVLGNEKLPGHVSKITPRVEEGKISVNVDIDEDSSLRLRNTVDVEVITAVREKILFVPLEAIVNQEGKNYLFVAENSRLKKVPVETGISNINYIEILPSGGIKKGDIIIGSASSEIKERMKINIKKDFK